MVIATKSARNNERLCEVARLAASDLGRTDTFPCTSPFRLEAAMRPRIDEIIRAERCFRVPLVAGCFVANT